MLYEIYKRKLDKLTVPGMFRMFPKCAERDKWDGIDEELKNHIISDGEKLLEYDWPRFKATDYLEYYRAGSRKSWDTVFKGVFDALTKLTMAECAENKGRFLDDIANGVLFLAAKESGYITGHVLNINGGMHM